MESKRYLEMPNNEWDILYEIFTDTRYGLTKKGLVVIRKHFYCQQCKIGKVQPSYIRADLCYPKELDPFDMDQDFVTTSSEHCPLCKSPLLLVDHPMHNPNPLPPERWDEKEDY